MDANRFFNYGGDYVKNPNYKKGNGQPKYIISTEVNPTNVSGTILSTADIPTVFNRDAESDRLSNAMIDRKLPLRRDDLLSGSFQDILADNQSNWSKGINAIAQTLISELAIGIPKGFSDLFDAVIGQWFTPGDNDYSNPLSETLASWQDKFNKEVAPIYVNQGVDIANGGFGNFGWYASNFPSIMSSLTLMAPGLGATKALSYAGKLAKLNKAGRSIAQAAARLTGKNALAGERARVIVNTGLENFTNASIMRTVENYQEARGTWTEAYKDASKAFSEMDDKTYYDYISRHPEFEEDGIDVSNKDAVAKHIATKAANRTFGYDLGNVLFDVIQLYGLKDIGRSLGFARTNISGAAKRAHRERLQGLQTITKTTEGTAEAVEQAQKSNVSKFWDYIKDNAGNWTKAGLMEGSEGIEEAVNYIAQEEGLTYGRVLLEKEKVTPFDERFKKYAKNPQLYESAFWGFLGGLVFEGGGSVINKARVVHSAKQAAKDRVLNEVTGESREAPSWIDILQTSEDEAAVRAIGNSNIMLNQLITDLKAIKNGINIFGKEDKITKEKPKFTGDVELNKAIARARLISEFRSTLALDAATSGTYDMLREYINDPAFRQVFIDSGLVSSDNIESFIQETISDMDKAVNIYDQQISHIKEQADYLSTRKGAKPIPLDYVVLMAKENTDHLLNIEDINRQIKAEEAEGSTERGALKDDIFYEELKPLILTARLAQRYGMLEARKKAVKEDKSISPMQTQLIVADLEAKQSAIMRELQGKQDEINLANMLYALRFADRTVLDNEDFKYSDSFMSKTDKELMEEYEKFTKTNLFSSSGKTVDDISKSLTDILAKYNKVTNNTTGLIAQSSRLFDIYQEIGDLQAQIAIEKSQIVSNNNEISQRVDVLHNQNNQVREKKVAAASDVINTLYAKYRSNFNNIEEIITLAYQGKHDEAERKANEILESNEAKELMNAIDIFNFTQSANDYIFKYIAGIINLNKEADKKAALNSSALSNSVSAGSQNGSNITSPNTSTSSVSSVNGQIGQNPLMNPQPTKELSKVSVSVNDEGVATVKDDSANGNIDTINLGNGVAELDYKNTDKANVVDVVDSDLFEDYNFDISDENVEWEVKDNPVIADDGNGNLNIIEKGVIGLVDSEEEPSSISSTGERATNKLTPDNPDETSKAIEIKGTAQEIVDNSDNTEAVVFVQSALNQAAEIQNKNFKPQVVKDKIIANTPEKFDKEAIGKIIDYFMNDAIELAKELGEDTLESGATGVILASKFVDSTSTTPDYSGLFKTSFDKFIEAYSKTLFTPTIDGKRVIKVADLMELCKQVATPIFGTDVNSVYNVIKGYLFANKDKYIILDEKDLANDTYDNSKTEIDEEIKTIHEGSYRINIDDILQSTNLSTETIEAIKNLRPGSKVKVVVPSDKRNKLKITTDYNGKTVIIGTMSIPSRVIRNNVLTNAISFSNGFVQILTPDGDHISSPVKELLINIFTSDDAEYSEVRELLFKDAAGLISRDNAIESLARTALFKRLTAESIAVKNATKGNNSFENILYLVNGTTPDYANLFSYMSNLIKYTGNITAETKKERRDKIVDSLTDWFDKLYDNYNAALNIFENGDNENNFETEVTYATEGELITVTTNTIADYDKLPYAKDGIGNEYPASLGIVDSNDTTKINLAGSENEEPVQLKHMAANSTVVIIKTPTANVPVKAVATHFNDHIVENSSNLKSIKQAIGSYLGSALYKYSRGDIEGVNQLKHLFAELFGENNSEYDRVGLLQGHHGVISYKVSTDSSGYENIILKYKDKDNNGRTLVIKTKGKRGVRLGFILRDDAGNTLSSSKVKVGDRIIEGGAKSRIVSKAVEDPLVNFTLEEAKELSNIISDIIINNSSFKISRIGIALDYGRPGRFAENAFAKYDSDTGKFVIDIPGRNHVHLEYDSYGDYMTENNLYKVNTIAVDRGDGKTSNFNIKGKLPINNKVVHIKLNTVSTRKSTESTEKKKEIHILPNSSITEYDMFKDIITTVGEHKGLSIAKKLFNLDYFNDPKFVELVNVLFPYDIVYDENMNDIIEKEDGSYEIVGDYANVAAKKSARYVRARLKTKSNRPATRRLIKNRVVIGDWFLSHLAGTQHQKQQALSHLVHEQLHNIINNNKDFTPEQIYDAIRDVYNEFRIAFEEQYSKDSNNPNYTYIANWLAKYNQLIYENKVDIEKEKVRLEEFIVESLTNNRFVDFLNSVEIENVGETKKSLFNKILDFVMKYIFNRDVSIKDNTLLRKELNLLAGTITVETTSTPVEENDTKEVGKETLDYGETYEDEDEDYGDDDYARSSSIVDERLPKSATNIIQIDDEEIFDDSTKEPFISSLKEFKRRFTLEEKEQIDNMIENGVLSYKCK